MYICWMSGWSSADDMRCSFWLPIGACWGRTGFKTWLGPSTSTMDCTKRLRLLRKKSTLSQKIIHSQIGNLLLKFNEKRTERDSYIWSHDPSRKIASQGSAKRLETRDKRGAVCAMEPTKPQWWEMHDEHAGNVVKCCWGMKINLIQITQGKLKLLGWRHNLLYPLTL